jgi:FAD/FMN-containing dehydrogenase
MTQAPDLIVVSLPQPDSVLVDSFATALRGRLVLPTDPDYDEARKVYNGMIDKRPAMIAQCSNVADVITSVNFARDNNLLLAIRGGGHNGPGFSTCDGGLVIDLSHMNGVHVDPAASTVRAEGGCTWGDVSHAANAFGLSVPNGLISTTGVGGFTLGGGLGYLTRQYGLTIDNLLEVDVVLADGRFVTANEAENTDLFWGVRGGGGNFGVVTSFLFKAHPVTTIVGGPILWTLDQAGEVMRWYRDFIKDAPRELSGWFGFITVPPVPPFPEHLHLQKVCVIVWSYTGPESQADEIYAPIRAFGPPLLDGTHSLPFIALQFAFDGLYPKGDQWYWKADFVTELTDEAIDLHVMHGRNLPTPQSTMHLYPINGAAHDVSEDATPWAYRHANFAEVIVGVDNDPANNDALMAWARSYWNDLHPHSSGGAYVNMMMDEGEDRVQASYRGNYDRLVEVKRTYDPNNLFRLNQNIDPAGA